MVAMLNTVTALSRISAPASASSSSRHHGLAAASAASGGSQICFVPRNAAPRNSSSNRNRPHSNLRRTSPIVCFRWDDSDTNSTTTTSNGSKPRYDNASVPPPIAEVVGHDEESALDQMQREERLRDVQRAAMEAFERTQSWWAAVPDKRSLLVGGAAAAAAAYLGSSVVAAVDRVPLLPRVFQAVGLGYSCWFWYRYVLFAEGRRQLRASLGALRRSVAERVDDLAEKTLDSHPNPGTGKTGAAATARGVVERLAARHTQQQAEGQAAGQQGRVVRDDGSWVDAADVTGGSPLDERYVEGLLRELDEKAARSGEDEDASSGGGGISGGAGRSPLIFALGLLAGGGDGGEYRAPQEAQEGGGGPSQQPGKAGGSASLETSATSSSDSSDPRVADLDPCLGWDTEACAASGRMKLGDPDNGKLEELAQLASSEARKAVGFSKHVDQVLHAPVNGSPVEVVNLEGQHGRAAGTMERAAMEEFAATHPNIMSSPSTRKPALGEEAGTGPQL